MRIFEKISSAKRGIEPKRPITFDQTQFGPVLRTPDLLNKARKGGYATYETAKDNLPLVVANHFIILIQNLSVLRPELRLSPHLAVIGTTEHY